MAEHREPPPLFSDDESRKNEDTDDLFSSAVQSPVNGQVGPQSHVHATATTTAEPTTATTTAAAATITTTTSMDDQSHPTSLAVSSEKPPNPHPIHPLLDPLQSELPTPVTSLGGSDILNANTINNMINTTSLEEVTSDVSLQGNSTPGILDRPLFDDDIFVDSPTVKTTPGLTSLETSSRASQDLSQSHLDPMTSSNISNLPPVPSNMYNISSLGSGTSSLSSVLDKPSQIDNQDLFESCIGDEVVRPFSTVSLTANQEVPLDDDDDGLFSSAINTSAKLKSDMSGPATLTSTTSPSALPPMGAPITPPTTSPAPHAAYPTNNDAANNLNANLAPAAAVAHASAAGGFNSSTTKPAQQQSGFCSPGSIHGNQLNAGLNNASHSSNDNNSNKSGEYIEVLISEPQKVGDGMGSYMAYKITTRTNIPYFRKQQMQVTRRFSDYLGLHSKLVEKHLHAGRIIPPAPEKHALSTTKMKLGSSDGGMDGFLEFLERRRASLQRFMQRTAALPHLRADPDFREFLELDAELPRASQTSAMSSAGVMRLFNRVGETVNKITFKMEESDQWFEERVHQIESLEVELRRLHSALEGLAGGRRELAVCSSSLSKAAAVLSSVEEHSALSRALHQLAEATERTQTVYHAQADADFYILCETTRDYINLIGAVKDVFHERVKVFQAWQYAQTMLEKKREIKAKQELAAARQEKIHQAQEEVLQWEGKVERNQEHFTRISTAIKAELQQFDISRVQDFQNMLVRYLEAMVASQQQVIKVWESFLPEAKAIS